MKALGAAAVLGFALAAFAISPGFAASAMPPIQPAPARTAPTPPPQDPSHKHNVSQEDNRGMCMAQARRVRENAAQHQQASNHAKVVKLEAQGLESCRAGDYTVATARLTEAGKLLGMRQ